jgi:hypothetical protein
VEAKVEEKLKEMTSDEGLVEMTKLLGEDVTKKFNMWLIREGEKERLLLEAREQRKHKYQQLEKLGAIPKKPTPTPSTSTPPASPVASAKPDNTFERKEDTPTPDNNGNGNDNVDGKGENKDNGNGNDDIDTEGKTIEEIKAELDEIDVTAYKPSPYVFAAGSMDKDKRKAIHTIIRDCWPTLVSDVVDAKGDKPGKADNNVAEADKAVRVRATVTGRAGM